MSNLQLNIVLNRLLEPGFGHIDFVMIAGVELWDEVISVRVGHNAGFCTALEPGRLEIHANTAVAMLESLLALAMVMQNDLDRFAAVIEPTPASAPLDNDEELRGMIQRLRDAEQAGVTG